MSPSAVPSGRTSCQSALAPGSSFPVELRPGECAAGQGHDAPVALGGLAQVERPSDCRLEAVHEGQAGVGKVTAHGLASVAAGSLGWGESRVTVTRIQS